ncbi:TNF receptor-associated factor like [Actinidia chinensis var. chinensis]|uniref:TNF receptor-associated factor like n=1 Tax=Actinidia chinensis var. chinensis TaxID=1590841 RepID=A0A2R6S209_ACTCC|nr:TNF receptor-associated factor like [Actinidia chinensis var. chinensis]
MDLPATATEVKPEKFEESKEPGPFFRCGLLDTEVVHKIAQVFLPGLASACVDNTTGGLFRSPASVAVDMRKEMVAYLTQRSETFVAESFTLENDPEAQVSDHPYDIISDMVDDFASSKRNIFSRVSGWILSERREDRIDDFVQEMEISGFWFMDRREAVAQTLLKNVDFKNAYHCNMKFNMAEELARHSLQCSFRTMNCPNEGCNVRFCAAHLENHDSICPFKILPCEQKCSDSIMRREMDKHCITVCSMKLVNCPFYLVGCQSTTPLCNMEQHCLEDVHSHLLYVLQVIHKDAFVEDLKRRVVELEESAPPGRLAAARDVRSLTLAIKDLEAELGPLKVNTKVSEDLTASPNKKEELAPSATQEEANAESPRKKEEFTQSTGKKEEHNESPTKEEQHDELSSQKEDISEEFTESPSKNKEFAQSPSKKEHSKSPPKKEQRDELSSKKEDFSDSPPKDEEYTRSPALKEECSESATKEDKCMKSPTRKEARTHSSNLTEGIIEEVEI